MFYVEKYINDAAFQSGEMSSCKKFPNYTSAKKYFDTYSKKYKRGFLILSEEDQNGFPQIIEEASLSNNLQ